MRLPGDLELPALGERKQFGHIRRVNVLMGLFVPVTPLELLEAEMKQSQVDPVIDEIREVARRAAENL